MRNIKRIAPFLDYIESEWLKNPDYRFGQLLINLGIICDDSMTWNLELENISVPHEYLRFIQHWGILLREDNIFISKLPADKNIWSVKIGDYDIWVFVKSKKKPTMNQIWKQHGTHYQIPLAQLTNTHIKNILKTQNPNPYMTKIFKEELKFRKKLK